MDPETKPIDSSHEQVVPYNPAWATEYEIEAEKLKRIFGDELLGIEHIGSTSVPGLAAKPIIDIAVLIADHKDVEKFIPALQNLDYVFDAVVHAKTQSNERHFFRKGKPSEFHLSVAYADKGSFWKRQLAFRDYLRANPDERDRYAALKKELIAQDPTGQNTYIGGKTDLINEMLDKSGFVRWRSPAELEKIESYIAVQDMVSVGVRRPDILEARIKVIGWTSNLKKEIGIGYKTMVINSLGEQWADKESVWAVDSALDGKDMAFARLYIEKLDELNLATFEKIKQNPNAPKESFEVPLSRLLTYFMIIRWVIEEIYEKLNSEDQKYIDEWRNRPTLFSSLDFLNHIQPPHDPADWSVISIDGKMSVLEKMITCNKAIEKSADISESEKKEIKGRIGYPGKVSGKARVVLNPGDRDLVEPGEIIIASMTTLDFLPAMGKAAAFVTDEGGVTCHAAIVAREMKKPCIIGTKIATQVIKTGDMLEVDADAGIIRMV